MKIIGLTGGIGTGKSTVSEYLNKKGCVIIDADAISRAMTDRGAPALKEIEKTFGKKYISADGSLNRKALGDLVFGNKEKLEALQKVITEKVIEEINDRICQMKEEGSDKTVIIDAPLLFECGMEGIADENWLVTADTKVRLLRVSKRDNLSEEQIMARIENQMPDAEKIRRSRCVIDNSAGFERLYEQIDLQLERIENER